MVYCNDKFAEIMCLPSPVPEMMHFETILKRTYDMKQGINIETENFAEWLQYVRSVRRSRDFLLFEVDFTDGRWFLFSEQLNQNGDMLIQLKDITKQKLNEEVLKSSLSDIRRIALTDELCRVANRRSFVESVNGELGRCRNSGAAMTLLVLDLDLFKQINDSWGHPTGDAMLVHATQLMGQSLRETDIHGRIGGEEFAIFLSNTRQNTAIEIVDRIRKRIESNPLQRDGKEIAVTVSIGVTTLGCNAQFDQLYSEADQALYAAKKTGRNRVVHFADLSSSEQ